MNPTLSNLMDQINQLKAKINDPALRSKVLENIEKTKATVQIVAKDVAQQARDSRLVTEYVMPMIESEKTEQAIKKLGDKLDILEIGPSMKLRIGSAALADKIINYRQSLIDAKVAKAKPAVETEKAVTAEGISEDLIAPDAEATPKKRSSKSSKTESA